MKIQVTKEDVTNGKQGDGKSCPIALAVKRATKKNYSVSLFSVWNEKHENVQKLTSDIINKISLFDKTGEMEPFSFNLNI